jgi:hypothetical protein
MHHASTPEQVRLLCEYGAKINIKGEMGRAPLLNSIRLCNWPVVTCLLEYEANPNKKDSKGNTPLHMAIKRKSLETVKLLLNSGADWSQETFSGICPLYIYFHIADHIQNNLKELLQKNNVEAIKQLIHTPCMQEIDMDSDFITWIKKEGVDAAGVLFPAANILIKNFEERELFDSVQFINAFAHIMEPHPLNK